MVGASSLSTVLALARAGALDRAWDCFAAAGFDNAPEEPAALAVKGRLLKDRAARAQGDEQRRLWLRSAEAYRRSADLRPSTYPLINAATLLLLAGEPGQAQEAARNVLDRIAREPEEPETPYWRAATRAEALLLSDRRSEAEEALAEAMAEAPQAWEDHASTLRQFLLIHQALGQDAAWLEMLRPPRSLHFSGRIEVADAAEVTSAAADLLARERIGFGYGALAAGADIIVAEALLAAGAELHVVLPSDAESFARHSVDPYGTDWRRRFDAALAAAATVYPVRPLRTAPGTGTIQHADQVAAGMARLNADRLLAGFGELAVGSPRATRRPPEYVIDVPGEAPKAPAPSSCDLPAPLLALLSISVGTAAEQGYEDRLAALCGALQDAPAEIPPHFEGDEVVTGLSTLAEAVGLARRIQAELGSEMPLRIAGHYGFVPVIRDPFLGTLRPTAGGAAILRGVASATPPDTICVSLDFAAVLAAEEEDARCANWIGELRAFDGGPPIPLYALRPQRSDD
jgi:tetratricopeptide (TPR) repeat protein